MLLVLKMPAKYLGEDISPDNKKVFDYYDNALKEIIAGTKQYLLLPSNTYENGTPLFSLTAHSDASDGFRVESSDQ